MDTVDNFHTSLSFFEKNLLRWQGPLGLGARQLRQAGGASLRVTPNLALLRSRDGGETWEAVEQQRRLRQEAIEMDNELSPDLPQVRVPALMRQYAGQLESRIPALSPDDAQRLSYGQTGEWLMRCPLRFRSPT